MPVDASLYTQSQAHGGLSALISTRFYPERERTGELTFPYVTFTLVSVLEAAHTFSTPTDFERDDQWRFHVWATSHDSARNVAKQIILAFHDYSDAVITGSIFQDEIEVQEDEDRVYHRVLDFQITSNNDNS